MKPGGLDATRLFLMLKELAVLLYWKETGFDSDVCIVGRRTMTSVCKTKSFHIAFVVVTPNVLRERTEAGTQG